MTLIFFFKKSGSNDGAWEKYIEGSNIYGHNIQYIQIYVFQAKQNFASEYAQKIHIILWIFLTNLRK